MMFLLLKSETEELLPVFWILVLLDLLLETEFLEFLKEPLMEVLMFLILPESSLDSPETKILRKIPMMLEFIEIEFLGLM